MDLRETLCEDFRAELREEINVCLSVERDMNAAVGPLTSATGAVLLLRAYQRLAVTVCSWAQLWCRPADLKLSTEDVRVIDGALQLVGLSEQVRSELLGGRHAAG